jgi:hypothetical protein
MRQTWLPQSKNVCGPSLHGENPPKFRLLKPNPFDDCMIAQISPKELLFLGILGRPEPQRPDTTFLGSLRTPGLDRPAMVKESGQRLLTDVLMTCQYPENQNEVHKLDMKLIL